MTEIRHITPREAALERENARLVDKTERQSATIHVQADAVEALREEVERLKADASVQQNNGADAERYRWLRDNSTEQLLNPSRANLNNDFAPMDIRTCWKTPVLICSGPVGGFLGFDESVDAMKESK